MKVNRQGYQERHSITVDWINDLTKKIEANPSFLNNIKSLILPTGPKFSSIEEKLSDIKLRVGFDLVKNDHSSDENIKSASPCDCGGHAEQCSCETIQKTSNVDRMSGILKYIQEMIRHEPHLSVPTVISKCRQERGLHFDELRIDMEKLKKFIDQELNKHENKAKGPPVSYIPNEPGSTSEIQMDDEAEYYKNTTRAS